MRTVAGFDTETVKSQKLVGKYWVEEHQFLSFQLYPPPTIVYRAEELEELLKSLPDKSLLIGWKAEFDLTLLRKILRDDWIICFRRNESRFLKGEISHNGKTFEVIDLKNLLPLSSLKRVGDMIGIPKLERPEYLGERGPQNAKERRYFEQYGIRDAEICFKAFQLLRKLFPSLEVRVHPTLPSVSFYTFLHQYGGKRLLLKLPWEVEAMAWEAYHGGRTETFIRGSPSQTVKVYDFNSLYPYAMSSAVFPLFKSYEGKVSNLDYDKVGLADALVYQDADIPLLGKTLRFPDGTNKYIFPVGRMRGVFTFAELYRLEKWGVGKVLKVFKSVRWASSSSPFSQFVQDYYERRKTGGSESKIYKLFLNALYGKFAQAPDVEEVKLLKNGEVNRKQLEAFSLNNPVVSTIISSQARLILYRAFIRVGFENVYYCDTDSIHTPRSIDWTSSRLGGLKFEGEGSATYVRAKCYVINETVKWKGWGGFIKGSAMRREMAKGSLKHYEDLLVKSVYALRLKVPMLSNLKRWKVFSLEPDGKRYFPIPLNGKELLTDWVRSEPWEVKDPEAKTFREAIRR